MSANVLLYSSHLITQEELTKVIVEAGGVILPPGRRSFGGLIDGEAAVWIDIIPCYDGVFDWEGNPLNEDDMVLLDQAKDWLGGEFQTWMDITLGEGRESGRLAVRFAHACCQYWPCVVDDSQPKSRIFSCQEIEQLYREGGAFTGYGL